MKETYNDAMTRVYADEGGYSNDAGDAGGPTNYGITIWDARKYWKAGATANDVKNLPKTVAANIYKAHYADPIAYDQLPPGVDYAVFDYGINSGNSRSVKDLQVLLKVPVDGIMGPKTLDAVSKADYAKVINSLYDARVSFLKSLGKPQFIKGWLSRCARGRTFALSLLNTYGKQFKTPAVLPGTKVTTAGAVIATGAAIAHNNPHHYGLIIAGVVVTIGLAWLVIHYLGKK